MTMHHDMFAQLGLDFDQAAQRELVYGTFPANIQVVAKGPQSSHV